MSPEDYTSTSSSGPIDDATLANPHPRQPQAAQPPPYSAPPPGPQPASIHPQGFSPQHPGTQAFPRGNDEPAIPPWRHLVAHAVLWTCLIAQVAAMSPRAYYVDIPAIAVSIFAPAGLAFAVLLLARDQVRMAIALGLVLVMLIANLAGALIADGDSATYSYYGAHTVVEIARILLVVAFGLAAWLVARRRSLVTLWAVPLAAIPTAFLITSAEAAVAGTAFCVGAAWLAVLMDKKTDPRTRGNPSHFPVDHTRHGQLMYPVVGYLQNGLPVYGNAVASYTPGYHVMAQRRTNTMAILALVFGLMGSGVIAIVMGHVAHGQIKRTGEDGAGMATAGLVLGYLVLLLSGALIAFLASGLEFSR